MKNQSSNTYFLSYSRSDIKFAKLIYNDLKRYGMEVFGDFDIPAGAEWDNELEKFLGSSKTLIVLLSPKSVNSSNVKNEINYALQNNIEILPVRIQKCQLPLNIARLEFIDLKQSDYAQRKFEVFKELGMKIKIELHSNKKSGLNHPKYVKIGKEKFQVGGGVRREKPTGERMMLTVLLCNVPGFTIIENRVTDEQVFQVLYEYLTEMTEIILRNGGIIDKYEKDVIQAEFGLLEGNNDHEYFACNAAIEMINRMADLQESWKKMGRPQLEIQIGVNSGVMYIGSFGSEYFSDFTVLGTEANLALKNMWYCKDHGLKCVIGSNTQQKIEGSFQVRKLDVPKNSTHIGSQEIYELISGNKK